MTVTTSSPPSEGQVPRAPRNAGFLTFLLATPLLCSLTTPLRLPLRPQGTAPPSGSFPNRTERPREGVQRSGSPGAHRATTAQAFPTSCETPAKGDPDREGEPHLGDLACKDWLGFPMVSRSCFCPASQMEVRLRVGVCVCVQEAVCSDCLPGPHVSQPLSVPFLPVNGPIPGPGE